MSCRPLQFEVVKVCDHSLKLQNCILQIFRRLFEAFLTYYIPLRTTYLFGGPKLSSTLQIFFRRLGFTCFFSSTTWFRVFNWLHRILGREKRSAQTSAHPLSQAQSGLFCVSLFVCVVLRKKGRILEVNFDGDAVVLVDSDLWLLKICRQSVKLHQDEAILLPLIQVTG